METLSQVINKRDTFNDFLALIPEIPAEFKDRIGAARALWNTMTITRQRQIYYEVRKMLREGEKINPNPYFLINDCHPQPTNWNGRPGINSLIKSKKMVIAKYNGSWGSYTLDEAKLYEMTDVKPLN